MLRVKQLITERFCPIYSAKPKNRLKLVYQVHNGKVAKRIMSEPPA